ncbi:MAG: ABC transporter ATP-binding protein [Candidatus Hydrogenedentes bacterium]|nr:ABC transporter ATP-binding protein [Candidatus Hydrogenedentota bacterium]
MQDAIEARNLTKDYRIERGIRLLVGRGGVLDMMRGRKPDVIRALDDVTFTVAPGESLGIIGANGSGKSTLLKLFAGVTAPTSGEVRVYGRVASLLELGAGFHPMLTGRENVYLNAGLLGLRHRDVDRVFDDIVRFSGIDRFIEYPVDTYSSGMYVRLAFSVAVHANPDIFLIDEVLSVGDAQFQNQCRQKLGELHEQGKTLVFVSHDLGLIGSVCERVLLMSDGKLTMQGTPKETTRFYMSQVDADSGLHTMQAGDTVAQFDQGRIRITHAGQELSTGMHLYQSILAGNLWNDSSNLRWESLEREDNRLRFVGVSRRLPYSQEWILSTDADSITVEIWILTTDTLEIQEYQTSILLGERFTDWKSPHETGTFPDTDPQGSDWQHLNRNYAPGTWIEATGENVPTVRLEIVSGPVPRMTALQTDAHFGARVLQALVTPDAQALHFDTGRHLLFSGRITVTPQDA